MLYQVNKDNTTKAHIQMLLDHHILVPVLEPVFVYRDCMTYSCKQNGYTLDVIHDCDPGYVEMFGGAYEES